MTFAWWQRLPTDFSGCGQLAGSLKVGRGYKSVSKQSGVYYIRYARIIHSRLCWNLLISSWWTTYSWHDRNELQLTNLTLLCNWKTPNGGKFGRDIIILVCKISVCGNRNAKNMTYYQKWDGKSLFEPSQFEKWDGARRLTEIGPDTCGNSGSLLSRIKRQQAYCINKRHLSSDSRCPQSVSTHGALFHTYVLLYKVT